MPKIHNVFILKDGVPIFHVNPVRNLIENNQAEMPKPESMDSALVAGFLSAIASFAYEIGIGTPKTYETDEMKFSFLSQNDFLFILGTTNLPVSDVQAIIKEIAEKFIEMVSVNNLNISTANLSPFNGILKEILVEYVTKFDLLLESKLIEEYVQLIPQSHIGQKNLERLSEAHRVLFKLIDGSNSLFEIAKASKQAPRVLLGLLRSYTKSGLITFQRQNTPKMKRLKL